MTWSPLDLLPGLYVVLLAVALAAALRRWFDPVPWRVLGVFLLLIGLLFGRALFAGWTLLPLSSVRASLPYDPAERISGGNWLQGDLVFQIAPWNLEVRRAVAEGRWPLWNTGAGIGMPLMGDPQAQFLQPLIWLAWPFPLEAAAGVTAALRVLSALLFTFLFLRRQGLGQAASTAGAVIYGLGGFVQLWLGWPIGNAAALLPAALYGVARCADPGRRRDFALLAAVLAALFLGGHPETVIYGAVLAGCWWLARVLAQVDAPARRRLLVRGAAAFLVAGCLAAPVLLLAQEYLPQSGRARTVEGRRTGRPLAEAGREIRRPGAWAEWRERTTGWLLPVAAVHAFGELGDSWGFRNVIEDQCGFAGAAPLLAAGAALWPFAGPAARRRRFPHERFFAGTLAVSLLLLAQPPGFDRLFLRLPVIGMTAVHHHHRILMLVTFCIAVLAAAEIERWRRGEGRRAAVAGAAIALASLILWAYLAHPSPQNGRIITGFLDGGLAAQLSFLTLAALLLLRPGGERARAGAWGLAALCAAELLLAHGAANPAAPARVAYPVTPHVRFLREHQGFWRMAALGSCFPPNLPLVYGLRDARVNNPSVPAVQALLTEPLDRFPLMPRFTKPRHPLYDLLGVRWLVVRPGQKLPFRLAYQNRQAWIFERPHPLPPLFLPRQARVVRTETWPQWTWRNTDFSLRALVPPRPGHRKDWRSRKNVPSRLELISWEEARFRARADLGEPRLLASSIFQDRHWHLLVDGQRVPTTLANGPLVAAWLPAGRHELELLYRPWRLLPGCTLAACALALACALWIPPPRRRAGW